METETETVKKEKINFNFSQVIIEGTIIFVISIILSLMVDTPRGHHGRRNNNQKMCFTNQKILMGAIELYNMDHKEKIKDCNTEIYDLLIKNKYLKENSLNSSECDFICEGDLSDNGFIYCPNHGSLDGKIKGKDISVSTHPKRDSMIQQRSNLIKFGIAFGPLIFYLTISLLKYLIKVLL